MNNSSFKKQEYIHLHGLLNQVAEYVDEESVYGDIEDVETYQQYLDNDIKPTSIHKSKTDHKESVFLLVNSINDFLDGEGQASNSKFKA
jgi:hypothetical protein